MKLLKRIFGMLLLLLLLAVIIFFLGPRTEIPILDNTPIDLKMSLNELDEFVKQKDENLVNLRPNNASRLVWANDSVQQTEYVIVYLHGFSASGEEGAPIHEALAKRYNANLYIPLLAGHGIADIESFKDMKAQALVNSAREAIAIGKLLGKKILVLSCSTGSTLGLFLAAADPAIESLVMYSPNIDMHDEKSEMLVGPWGLQIARQVFGGNHRGFEANEEVQKYWTNHYRIEGVIMLKSLLKSTMKKETFEKITQPLYAGYYYKNEEEFDKIISIEKIHTMMSQVKTPSNKKHVKAFADVGGHVLASKYWSKDIATVQKDTEQFIDNVVGWKPAKIAKQTEMN